MGPHPQPLHLVFFPFLARSHMIPLLETARLAAERGVRITLVTTPANAHLLRPTVDRANSSAARSPPMDLRLIPFRAADFGLPDGCENLTAVPLHLAANFFNAVFALRGPLDGLLRELRPDAIVSDALFPWTTALAGEHDIPRLIFQVTGLFPLCAANDLDLHRPYEAVAGRGEPFAIPGFPHGIKLTKAELPEVFDFPIMLSLLREAELTSYGVVVNSFYDLEPEYAEHYYKVGSRKVFLVGPVAIAGDRSPAEKKDDNTRDPCLGWLDTKADSSVVYVSFGTLCRFSEEQLRQLALGLEASGHNFLWAVRADGDGGDGGDGWMPEGWEAAVAERGMVVRGWAPQTEILEHRAVGGFVIHCGWNSVMEAVCAGVPMITWPLHSEQFVIEKLLTEVMRVARPVWDGFKSVVDEEKVVVPAAAVAGAIKWLMGGGEEAGEARRRVRELGEMGRRAVAEGGSSYTDMDRLIQGLKQERHQAKK